MARGNISHIALAVSDLERSAAFYDRVFEFIGFKRVEVPESTQLAMKTRLNAWVGAGYSISIRPSKGEFAHRLHDRNAPGTNHMAFSAESRSEVEKMYELLKEMRATVLDAPTEYPYSPGYFAVYFTDPDGLKFEFAYSPSSDRYRAEPSE
ncbi:MAG TPA: VOC family protein [Candidatus Binatus sp.]|uniref:VOC family protein n=1 Tax=Candidatus Binatus sp. TaxID=2811406 RepID=UPI002F410C45